MIIKRVGKLTLFLIACFIFIQQKTLNAIAGDWNWMSRIFKGDFRASTKKSELGSYRGMIGVHMSE